MGRHQIKRLSAASMVAAVFSLLFSVGVAAQEDSGEILQFGDGCFVEELVSVTTEVSSLTYTGSITATVEVLELQLVSVPCEDEVLGITVEPDEVLAFTGSDINRPISLGFALVGVGGLLLYSAKRAERRDDETVDV